MNTAMTLGAGGCVLFCLTAAAKADSVPGSARGLEALAICHAAAAESDRAHQAELLDRGLALAEEALRADDADPAAHFAVFCNLGRRTRLRPFGLGSLGAVRRVRHEIDRALELAPDSPNILTAKGILLLELPAILGGDAREGERLLRRTLEVSPGFADAWRVLAARGRAESIVAATSR